MILDDCHIRFINLDHRTDRLTHMTTELNRVGLQAERLRGMPWQEYSGPPRNIQGMITRRTPGAIGCHYSQVKVMEQALDAKKHAFVMEDDLIFASDIHERLLYIESWMQNHEWDVFWLGSTFHVNPPYWHKSGHSSQLTQCHCKLGRDAERTDDPRIIRTYGAFSTYCYIVNVKSLQKVLDLLADHVHESIGIDWLFIRLQPQLKTFAFVPGSAFQIDNQSDIGNGMTMFSGFKQLNGTPENSAYVFQDKIIDFNPLTFNWHECN